jgi:hypothetical protein
MPVIDREINEGTFVWRVSENDDGEGGGRIEVGDVVEADAGKIVDGAKRVCDAKKCEQNE